MHNLNVGIVLWNEKSCFVECNKKFLSIQGDAAKELVPGMPFETYIRNLAKSGAVINIPSDQEQWVQSRITEIQSESSTHENLVDGKTWLQVNKQKLADGSTITTIFDITDLRQTGQELENLTKRLADRIEERTVDLVNSINDLKTEKTEREKAEEQLRQAHKMEAVGQLTGGIAHDFNNLLAAVLGNLELLKWHDEMGDKSMGRVDRAISAVERGRALTQRLLAFSRKQSLNPIVTDVAALLNNMRDLLQRSLNESIEIKTESNSQLWPVRIDRNQLENALLNLSINARDAMPDGGTLEFSFYNKKLDDLTGFDAKDVTPGNYTAIAVTDTGTGISPEDLKKVFEPFFTTKEFGSGSGLGLSMVFGFVKQSGGHVQIESELGVGTTVTIYLPESRSEILENKTGEISSSVSA